MNYEIVLQFLRDNYGWMIFIAVIIILFAYPKIKKWRKPKPKEPEEEKAWTPPQQDEEIIKNMNLDSKFMDVDYMEGSHLDRLKREKQYIEEEIGQKTKLVKDAMKNYQTLVPIYQRLQFFIKTLENWRNTIDMQITALEKKK